MVITPYTINLKTSSTSHFASSFDAQKTGVWTIRLREWSLVFDKRVCCGGNELGGHKGNQERRGLGCFLTPYFRGVDRYQRYTSESQW